jgi:hypothetical protein
MRLLGRLASRVSRRESKRITRRSLLRGAEALEPRLVMACDVGDAVLFTSDSPSPDPADVNRDGFVSPLDAVLVANAVISGAGARGESFSNAARDQFFLDASGNGTVDADDFDLILSRLSSSRQQETTEPTMMMAEGESTLPAITVEAFEGMEGNHIEVRVISEGSDQVVSSVDFEVQGVSATAGDDFRLSNGPPGVYTGTVTFPVEEFEQTFYITLEDDSLIEGSETLRVVLSNPVNATLGTPSTDIGDIYDNDWPVANDDGLSDEYWTLDTQELYVPAAEGVLVNDYPYDPNASQQQISAELITPPQHGTLELYSNGSFRYTPEIDFAGIDVFEYRATALAGQLPSNPAFVYLGVDRLVIKLGPDTTGPDITNQLTSFWTGELVGLNASLDPRGPQSRGMTATTWTIPGEAVHGYIETLLEGRPDPLTDAHKAGGHIDVYWITAGLKTVSLTATVGGFATSTKTTSVFVAKPEGTITAEQDVVMFYYHSDAWWAGLGDFPNPNAPPGIKFTRTASTTPDGKTFFRQTLKKDQHGFDFFGAPYRMRLNGTTLLDNTPDYGDTMGENVTDDNPAVNLSASFVQRGINHVYGRVDFQMYTMWISNRLDSIPVPLQRLDWFYDLAVKKLPTAPGEPETWVPFVEGDPPGDPRQPQILTGVDWTALPEWYEHASNDDWENDD